jgi:DNA transformation protein
MPVSDDFMEFCLDQLSGLGDVSARRMFGGAGLYCRGKMFGLLANDVAYLKVDDSNRAMFEQRGSEPFRPYADKPAAMPYYEVPIEVLEDPIELLEWAGESLRIALEKK